MSLKPNFFCSLDTASAESLVEVFEESVGEFVEELAEEVERSWRMHAANDSTLRSTKQKYLDAIEVNTDGGNINLSLTDPMAASLELGASGFDLKPGFLQNRQYRVIPLVEAGTNNVNRFRTVTPNSRGWKHPGLHPRKIVDKVRADAGDHLVGEVFSRVIGRTKA